MKKKILAMMMIVFMSALFACGGGGGSDDYTPSVYVAGAVSTGTGSNACYWKDGVRVDLPGDNGKAYGIAVANGHVYVVGYYTNTTKACIWVDGVQQDLNGKEAKGIKIVGNTVYIAGRSNNDRTCVWINGVMSEVNNTNSWANAIYVTNDTIYVAGVINQGGADNAAIWSKPISGGAWTDKNLQSTTGYDYSEAFSVAVDNGIIYVTGYQNKISDDNKYPFLWSGNSLDSLSANQLETLDAYSDGVYGYAYSTSIFNGQSYVSGLYQVEISGNRYYRAALWVGSTNPILYALEDENDSAAFSVFVYNGDVYVAGNIEKPKSGSISEVYVQPCYWKNGIRVDLSIPSETGSDATDYYLEGAHAIIIQ